MKNNNKTSLRYMKHIAICIGLTLFLVSVAVPVTVSCAQRESDFPEYYPPSFDRTGRIDRISRDDVVINDCLFKLSPDVEYHTQSIENASSAWFKEGKLVGYITSSRRVIVSLWLIE